MLPSVSELIRIRTWKGLSDFEYANPKTTTIGASKGGVKVAKEAMKLH